MPFLTYQQQRLHYRVAGQGPRPLLAVHGFLGSTERFRPLGPTLERHFRVYYFDLPHHGLTDWRLPKVLPEDLLCLIDFVQATEGADRIDLLGYSLGAKVGLSLYLRRPAAVARLWLLAPDGLQTKYLHWVEKLPGFVFDRVGRMGDQPEKLQAWARSLRDRGVLPPTAYQFVQWNLSTPERRARAVLMWHTLRDFALSPKQLRRTIAQHNTPVELLLGKHDPYIPYQVWKAFGDSLPQVTVHGRETGHRLLDRTTAKWIEERVRNT